MGEHTAFAGQEERNLYMQYRETVFSNKDFKHIQQELESMEKSDDVFCIRMGKNCSSTEGGGNIIYNVETGQIDINIVEGGDFSPEGKLSHELKHVDQYLNRRFMFVSGRGTIGFDFNDEYEAYDRQSLFGDGSTLTPDQIRYNYPDLPFTDVNNRNEHPTEDWKKANREHIGHTGKPFYIYSGWRKDLKQ